MISEQLLKLVRCPECRAQLSRRPEASGVFVCSGCGREYRGADDYLDMRPIEQFTERTKYLDEALHADARHERVSPPLLGSKIRNDMLRRFLDPGPDDLVVDLGCGSGRTLLWNRDVGSSSVGIDISHEDQRLPIGGPGEFAHAAWGMGQLPSLTAMHRHQPDLALVLVIPP